MTTINEIKIQCFAILGEIKESTDTKTALAEIDYIWEDIADGMHAEEYELNWKPTGDDLEQALTETIEHLMTESKKTNMDYTEDWLWNMALEYLQSANED